VIKWARMSDLKDGQLIKSFFLEKGFLLVLYDHEMPPIVLAPLPLLFLTVLERRSDDLCEELRIKLYMEKTKIGLGKAANTHYLALLCEHLNQPIHLECRQPAVELVALSVNQYSYWFGDLTPLSAEAINRFNEKFRKGLLDK